LPWGAKVGGVTQADIASAKCRDRRIFLNSCEGALIEFDGRQVAAAGLASTLRDLGYAAA
jgi:hypothetical protein